MFALMAYGPYRFSLATFAYEEMRRKAEARIEEVNIIGGRPSLHRSGLGSESISLTSAFHPKHLPGNAGLSQVASMRASLGQTYPLIGNRIGIGDIFGSWALKSVEETQTEIFIDGLGQSVAVEIELLYDGRQRSAGAALAFIGLFG